MPCQQNDPELWFEESPESVAEAAALCATCPVKDAYLKRALANREPFGVWGGQLFSNGRIVQPRRRRRVGRPAKAEKSGQAA